MLKITREEDIPPLPPSVHATLFRVLRIERELAGPGPPDSEIYLLEQTDTDGNFLDLFSLPLCSIPFERVIHLPDLFLCYYVRNNSRCDTLVIPDADWLKNEWRAFLVSQQ